MSRPADPITLEIIESSLLAASDEMFAALRKTAMSAIIYEVLDMGTGITDADGNLASSGAGIPSFVGVLDKAVKRILELNPDHPLVAKLESITGDADRIGEYAEIVFGQAQLAEGQAPKDPARFNQLLTKLLLDR